jgi:hypothetical protein
LHCFWGLWSEVGGCYLAEELGVGGTDVLLDRDGELEGKQFLQSFPYLFQVLRRVVDDRSVLLVIFQLLTDSSVEGSAFD